VAGFIGEINLIPATMTGPGEARLGNGVAVGVVTHGASSGEVTLAIRPERLVLHELDDDIPDGRNRLRARVVRRTYFGDVFFYDLDIGLDDVLEVKEENRPDVTQHEVGAEIYVTWRASAATLVDD
jgi:ABC-type Fe3+/spermidine/putrescine transport system ATPase subunit